jgi:hypothetical protein
VRAVQSPTGDIAVVVPRWSDVAPVSLALAAAGIPVIDSTRQDNQYQQHRQQPQQQQQRLFDNGAVKAVLSALRCCLHSDSSTSSSSSSRRGGGSSSSETAPDLLCLLQLCPAYALPNGALSALLQSHLARSAVVLFTSTLLQLTYTVLSQLIVW